MKIGVFITLSAIITASSALAPLFESASAEKVIEGEYIVVFKEEASIEDVGFHKQYVSSMLRDDSEFIYHYEIGSEFRGYAARLSDEEVTNIRSLPNVKYIEKNEIVSLRAALNRGVSASADCNVQYDAPWGLVRTQSSYWPPQYYYDYFYEDDEAGEGVVVFVVDTGIDISHPDYEGRAEFAVDLTLENNYKDGEGHGTHVAGTVMSKTYGIAKKAKAIAVRVLDSKGEGSIADMIAGVNWVAKNKNKYRAKAVVMNLSIGNRDNKGFDDSVAAATKQNIHTAIASGNEKDDACKYSPKAPDAVLVGATTKKDGLQGVSNFGSCIDILAPGDEINSTIPGGKTATWPGTSMASPHVAGVMAKILSKNNNYTPPQLKEYLIKMSLKNKIQLAKKESQTPNRLLYKAGCDNDYYVY